LKIYAEVAVGALGCVHVELVDWDGTLLLVRNKESGAGEQIVMDLLRSAAIFEDQGDGFLVGGGRRWSGDAGVGRELFRLVLFRVLILRLREVAFGVGIWRRGRIVVTQVARIREEIGAYPSVTRTNKANARSIGWFVGSAITQASGVGCASARIASLEAPRYAGRPRCGSGSEA